MLFAPAPPFDADLAALAALLVFSPVCRGPIRSPLAASRPFLSFRSFCFPVPLDRRVPAIFLASSCWLSFSEVLPRRTDSPRTYHDLMLFVLRQERGSGSIPFCGKSFSFTLSLSAYASVTIARVSNGTPQSENSRVWGGHEISFRVCLFT